VPWILALVAKRATSKVDGKNSHSGGGGGGVSVAKRATSKVDGKISQN